MARVMNIGQAEHQYERILDKAGKKVVGHKSLKPGQMADLDDKLAAKLEEAYPSDIKIVSGELKEKKAPAAKAKEKDE